MRGGNLKVTFDGQKLTSNWQSLKSLAGGAASCGAAVKANAYGLGAKEVVARLMAAGCKDFFVATWEEAEEICALTRDCSVTVLNGVLDHEIDLAKSLSAKPMLNSLEQIQRWRSTGLPCDVMINTGMNRLGLNCSDAATIDWSDLEVDILASHLASADEDVPQNEDQLRAFRNVSGTIPHHRKSLANSAGIALGSDYHFDLTRPGLSLYGGVPRPELRGLIKPIGTIETRLLQIRQITAGEHVGYNATFTASETTTIGIAALGYADGYLRGFSSRGQLSAGGHELPILGRVSMDLVAVDLRAGPDLREGDWIGCELDLPKMSSQSGLSQYEIITCLGPRYDRNWIN